MITLKFKNYDSGFVRCYFKSAKGLYCVQSGYNYLPELLVCSRDGEPSHHVEDCAEVNKKLLQLNNKLKSMIENYCDHDYRNTYKEREVWLCSKCGLE